MSAQTAATWVDVTGLTNGTDYTFTVVASNAAGSSPPSTPSAPVTPEAPCGEEGSGSVGFAALMVAAAGDPCDPTITASCSNGDDDDGDGKTDHPSDPGCSSPNDNDETDPPVLPEVDTEDERWVRYPAGPGGPGQGKKILLSPAGHALNSNLGCTGTGQAGRYSENDGARAVANRAAPKLQAAGYEVYISLRDGSAGNNSGPRGGGAFNYDYAKMLAVDLHVPLHSNASGDPPFTALLTLPWVPDRTIRVRTPLPS